MLRKDFLPDRRYAALVELARWRPLAAPLLGRDAKASLLRDARTPAREHGSRTAGMLVHEGVTQGVLPS
jgi:hypothetical protein